MVLEIYNPAKRFYVEPLQKTRTHLYSHLRNPEKRFVWVVHLGIL